MNDLTTTIGRDNKEAVGLAGEYAAASELCKRGFYAQLTLGNHKKTDLLVESNNGLFRVSVKAKTGYSWPRVTGIWAPDDLLVFVDFKGKTDTERPDFYVLNVAQWKTLVKKLQKSKSGNGKIDKTTNTLYWDPWEGNDKGWKGCAVTVKDVVGFRDCWPAAN
ncbi:MAG: hypothetical protein HGA75_08085 [Thiobacillus sp.]|nr:hypothetical protein [Thiobacillus sp.]